MSTVTETPDLRVIERTSFERPVLCERADDIERDLRTNAFLADAAILQADVLYPADTQPFVAYRRPGNELELLYSIQVRSMVHEAHRLRRKERIELGMTAPSRVRAFGVA